jgi:GT2 family glycosyltransferase
LLLPAHRPATPDTTRLDYERSQAEQAWRNGERASDPHEARCWLERAYRFTPSDQNLAFALASACLEAGDPDAALALFEKIAARHPVREVLAGIAACALALGRHGRAREAVGRALSLAAPDPVLEALAAAVTGDRAGWCGVTFAGRVAGAAGPDTAFYLDGAALALPPDRHLPEGWRQAQSFRAVAKGRDVLGSPVDLRALTRMEGFAERVPGGIRGWAWHPGAPETDPVLTIVQDGAAHSLAATDLSVAFRGTVPLARPRGFSARTGRGAAVRVLGPDGRDLLGSPLGGPARARRAPPPRPGAGTAVIVPVYRGRAQTLACLRAVLATLGPEDRLIVVNDASPEPEMAEALETLAAENTLTLIPSCPGNPGRNLGFPAAANAGLLAAGGADAVLLNSDTIVHPGWLAALRAAAHAAPDIGTATPLSNDATIFTYPDPADPAPMPGPAEAAERAALALRVNAGITVDVPTGHGFCLYIRADCLHATGLLRPEPFAQGYGEENDFCERARARGWRHVAAPSVYVAHEGGVSFGTARHHLLARNAAILERLHPAYRGRVAAFIAADPLLPARLRLDAARLAAPGAPPAVLLITHGGHGGTTRIVRERAAALRALGLRPILLRGSLGLTQVAEDGVATPNLRFALPHDREALIRLLAETRPVRAELHHLLGHGLGMEAVLAALAIPFDVWVHDYNWLCARLALVTGEGRFCGEAPVTACDACVATWGDAQEAPITPAALRARSTALLRDAARVIAPSRDVARRLHRHFPAARLHEAAWEADPPPRPARVLPATAPWRIVAVVGALGLEKGYEVVLACARDAAARGLKLRFAVAGYTIDDTPLLETGQVFVTGPFRAADARATIAGLGAQLAFLPSIWPETWCFALSDIWDAGLDAAVFDIGTPALRVRRTGRGWVLPLGLPPARVNDALLNLQAPASRSGP